jgi:chromosome segregation ATPase
MYWRNRLKNQSKEELIERLSSLIQKTENQSKQLKQKESAIVKLKIKVKSYKLKMAEDLSYNKKGYAKLNQYEALLHDYRLEISDLKDEIDSWKERYLICLEKK